jgi:hypothetical protein
MTTKSPLIISNTRSEGAPTTLPDEWGTPVGVTQISPQTISKTLILNGLSQWNVLSKCYDSINQIDKYLGRLLSKENTE